MKVFNFDETNFKISARIGIRWDRIPVTHSGTLK